MGYQSPESWSTGTWETETGLGTETRPLCCGREGAGDRPRLLSCVLPSALPAERRALVIQPWGHLSPGRSAGHVGWAEGGELTRMSCALSYVFFTGAL